MSHRLVTGGAVALAVLAVASFAAFVLTGFWPYVVLEGVFLLAYGTAVRA